MDRLELIRGSPRGTAGSVAVLVVGQGLYGLAMGMGNSHEMSYRQLVTPDQLQARTNTTLRSLNCAVIVVVAPLAGIVADAWGIRPTMVLAAVMFALVAAGPGDRRHLRHHALDRSGVTPPGETPRSLRVS